jgi:hypothetical protein
MPSRPPCVRIVKLAFLSVIIRAIRGSYSCIAADEREWAMVRTCRRTPQGGTVRLPLYTNGFNVTS